MLQTVFFPWSFNVSLLTPSTNFDSSCDATPTQQVQVKLHFFPPREFAMFRGLEREDSNPLFIACR